MTIIPSDRGCHSRVVMVEVDDSPTAADACAWAAWLAAKTEAHLITAWAWVPRQSEGSPEDIAERRSAAESTLESQWSQPARLPAPDDHAQPAATGLR